MRGPRAKGGHLTTRRYPQSRPRDVARRGINLLLVTVAALALIGFIVGLDYGVPSHESAATLLPDEPPMTGDQAVVPATTYARMRSLRAEAGPRSRSSLDPLRPVEPDALVAPTPTTEQKLRSLQTRSERRAYNGAPPVIPHAVDQLGADSCLACHAAGIELEGRTARLAPHPHYENCLQCHAPPPPATLGAADPPQNRFDGVAAPFEGERAWVGAPPVVPHTTWMRSECLACHGSTGWPGMETTHPWRQNCLQCHAPSARLDLRPPSLDRADFLEPLRVSDG